MIADAPLTAGVLVGLSVSIPIGPMGILCINRTLATGFASGLCTGAGASTILACYGSAILLGMHELGPLLEQTKQPLNFAGGLLMLFFGLRLLLRSRSGHTRRRAGASSLALAYVSAAVFNATNPMLLVLLVASVTSIAGVEGVHGSDGIFVLSGMLVGSLGWWFVLSSTTALLRARLGAGALRLINSAATVMLFGFGILAITRSFAD